MYRNQPVFSILIGAILLASFGFSSPAGAYQLGDHKKITVQAVDEFNGCFPGLISGWDGFTLWTSDLDEDIDVLRKDLLYSHYFNPHKHLNMRRFDSSVRVSRLESVLLGDASDDDHDGFGVFAHLGHAIHHIQDMTVPSHVVPVNHWLNDGFERYDFDDDISSGLSCADLVAANAPDLNALLVSTAEQTLTNVAAIRLQVIKDGAPVVVSGDAFWQESSPESNGDFGQYGSLGNNYGSDSFDQGGASYEVPDADDFYAAFKQQQMKLAVRQTVRALYWFLIVHENGLR